MARRFTHYIILLFLLSLSISASPSFSKDDVLKKVLDRARENEKKSLGFGFYQTTHVKKMADGKTTSEETKEYKLIWLQGEPYLELVKKDGKELDKSEKKKEQERKAKFVKSVGKEDDEDDDDNLTWEDLYAKYDFQLLPSDDNGRYVFSFKPKEGKLAERSRTERVLNHVAGKFWVDEDFQITRAEANLLDNVKFGLGILGNLQDLKIQYEQRPYEQVQMPAKLSIYFKAKIAMVKTEERQIQATYSDYYRRPVQ
jgi:hypothetical protein